MIGYTTADKIRYWLFQDRIPFVKLLLISNLITFLAIAIFKQDWIAQSLSFVSPVFRMQPWTALTYPLVWATQDLIGLLFSGYWLWVAGGSLERAWGSGRFAFFFFAMSAISALGLYIGTLVVPSDLPLVVVLANLWVPLAGLTVAFAMINPEQQILFFFVIPLKLKYLAMISAALLLVQFAMVRPMLGLFALAGCMFAYMYVRRPTVFSAARPEKRAEVVRVFEKRSIWQSLNPFALIKEWNDKRKLKRLFERSYNEDDERGRR